MSKMIATIEARMTSSRLPGKVLLPVEERPLLEFLINRLKQVKQLEEIVVATTVNRTDDPIVKLAEKLNVGCFRGSEDDVLARVLGAARKYNADIIVEITGDCPLIDPEIVKNVIELYLKSKCDYASNVEPVTFPIGMDAQVFSTELLALADKEGQTREDREHVSWFIRRNPRRFIHRNLEAPTETRYPDISITLDEQKDYELISRIVSYFHPDMYFSCGDILKYLNENPSLKQLNSNVIRKGI